MHKISVQDFYICIHAGNHRSDQDKNISSIPEGTFAMAINF